MTVYIFYVLLIFFILGAVFVLACALYLFVEYLRFRVPYVSTPYWAIEWLKKNVVFPNGAVVYDLGCGDGRVLRTFKKKFPHITAVGYEGSLLPYLLALCRTRGDDITIRFQNFYHADISDADVVFCFLVASKMPKVEQFLRSKLKPGTYVYLYGMRFPNWEPTRVVVNPERADGSKLLVYRV